jgi:biotin carboxyl carrier protein
MLLPNESDYLELVYACAWLGLIAVPVNIRLSITEIDHVIADASPRGLIRHSSLAVPTVKLSWELVLDQEPLEVHGDCHPEAIYDPEAILALVYTSGTTGHPKGVVVTHANILADVDHFNYWTPYRDGGVHLQAAPIFHIMDFPFMFAAPAFGACQVAIPKFSPQSFCETVERERVSQSVLVSTMINSLIQFDKLENYDLTSLETLAYGVDLNRAQLQQQRQQVNVLDSQIKQAQATLKAQQAARDLAQINLGYTRITAPVDGMVGQRQVRPGQYVSLGTQVISLVPLPKVWVIANYKETQMTRIRVGQAARVTVDTFPGAILRGHVDSWSPASGAQFSLLPPDNATGNFTKVVQRIPVKIVLDPDPAIDDLLRPGMSVIATIDTATTPKAGATPP